MMKQFNVLYITLLCSALVCIADPAAASCRQPFVFFDLGQTVIDTDTHNYNPMFFLKLDPAKYQDAAVYPDAKRYLDDLIRHSVQLGIITDIPGAWGVNYPANQPVLDLPTAKIIRTMDFIAGVDPADKSSWQGERMDWRPFVRIQGSGAKRFAIGHMLLPQTDAERKRNGSLVLFLRAKQIAAAQGCPAIYVGESDGEMALAEQAGLAPFWVGHTLTGIFYLPSGQLANYVRAYRPGNWRGWQPAR